MRASLQIAGVLGFLIIPALLQAQAVPGHWQKMDNKEPGLQIIVQMRGGETIMPSNVTITRHHHPLLGHRLEVISGGASAIVVRVTDGPTMRIPRVGTTPSRRKQDRNPSRFCSGDAQGMKQLRPTAESH